MHLVELLIPVTDRATSLRTVEQLAARLTERFGGVTTFQRSPAEGQWKDKGAIVRDTIIVVEVMTDVLDRAWWYDVRKELEDALEQDEIIIRARAIERL